LFGFVSLRSLKSCRLEFEDWPLEQASLFPLFDEEGRTRVVMITAEENARIMVAEWAPGMFVRDWAMRNRVRLRFTDLSDASMWDEERLEDLWHFDLVGARRGTLPRTRVGARRAEHEHPRPRSESVRNRFRPGAGTRLLRGDRV
jgi:hypothetical protein